MKTCYCVKACYSVSYFIKFTELNKLLLMEMFVSHDPFRNVGTHFRDGIATLLCHEPCHQFKTDNSIITKCSAQTHCLE